ncbi:helix-turn-helix domain-containing protein [bacterium]|nr:helix-turn-helix domain-containing protein [bacterium]
MKKEKLINLMTSAEVAEVLGISERHLFNLRSNEEIEWVQHGRYVRFTPEQVMAYIRKHSQIKSNPLNISTDGYSRI